METQVHYNLAEKQLGFKLRERVTKGGFELKGNGIFNTTSGKLDYRATLKYVVHKGVQNVDAGTSPLMLGAGVVTTSAKRDELMATASAKKTIALFEGPSTVLSAKATIDYDVKAERYNAFGTFKLSHKIKGFTRRQDLKLTVGADVDYPQGAREPKPEPLFQARENNWAINYRRQKWYLTYDL